MKIAYENDELVSVVDDDEIDESNHHYDVETDHAREQLFSFLVEVLEWILNSNATRTAVHAARWWIGGGYGYIKQREYAELNGISKQALGFQVSSFRDFYAYKFPNLPPLSNARLAKPNMREACRKREIVKKLNQGFDFENGDGI